MESGPRGSARIGRKSAEEPGYQRPAPGPAPRLTPRTHERAGLRSRCTMADRRILETTQLLGALPPETLESAPSASTSRHDRPQRGAVPPGRRVHRAVRIVERARSRSSPGRPTGASRWSRCSRRGACSASSASSTRPALGRRPGARDDATSSCSPTTPCAPRSRSTRTLLWIIVRVLAAPAAQHRRSARRRGVPRRPRPHRQAAARARGRRRRVPAPDDPGGSRRPGRREPRAGEQGARRCSPGSAGSRSRAATATASSTASRARGPRRRL